MLTDAELIQQVRDEAVCLYDMVQIDKALDNMAAKINGELKDSCPIIMCVMNGGMIPMGKLLTRFDFILEVDYLHATRYHNETSGSDLEWKSEPRLDIKDRTVLVVDDILDEGITLHSIVEYCNQQGAAETFTAVLVEKIHDRKHQDIRADFVGLEVEDKYVFGYGMDYKGFLRNAPGIYAVTREL